MLVHQLFEQFYRDWDQDPGGVDHGRDAAGGARAIHGADGDALAKLPEADRVLERTRLLGIARGARHRRARVRTGSGRGGRDRAPAARVRSARAVRLSRSWAASRQRTIEIAGKADRIDVFDDGSLRVVDYKLSRLPDKDTSIQIAVYAHAAQAAAREDATAVPYRIARGDVSGVRRRGRVRGRARQPRSQGRRMSCGRASKRLPAIIDRIESGEFPPQPRARRHVRLVPVRRRVPQGISGGEPMKQPSLFDAPGVATAPDQALPPDQAARDFAVEPATRRRARGVGGHRQDARARGSVRPADRTGRRSAQHSGDHVHAQGRGRNARARAGRAAAARTPRAAFDADRWRALLDRIADIQISTIDAFCFGLLREFPLEAGVEPGFDVADETEIGRFSREAMDLALRAARGLCRRRRGAAAVVRARASCPCSAAPSASCSIAGTSRCRPWRRS